MKYEIDDQPAMIKINGQPYRVVNQSIEKISGVVWLEVEPLRKKRRRKTIRSYVRNDNQNHIQDNPYG